MDTNDSEARTTPDLGRRSLLKRAGLVAGTTVWATPTIQSITSAAFAAGSPVGCTRVGFTYEAPAAAGGGGFLGAGSDGGGCRPGECGDARLRVAEGQDNTQCVVVPGLGTYCVTVNLAPPAGGSRMGQVAISAPAGAAVDQATVGVRAGQSCVSPHYSYTDSHGTAWLFFESSEAITHVSGCFCAEPAIA